MRGSENVSWVDESTGIVTFTLGDVVRGDREMKQYDFTLVLARDRTDRRTGRGVVRVRMRRRVAGFPRGVVWVTLHREDESLEQAIRSGIADVQKAGCHVARVEIEPADLAVSAAAK